MKAVYGGYVYFKYKGRKHAVLWSISEDQP